jgi:hypothetical protein
MMTKLPLAFALTVFLAIPAANARESNAIARFVHAFPVPTYELNGQLSDKVIDSSSPPVSEITVDGLWPDKKMLLISFTSKPDQGYYILRSAVEMRDQKAWDERMQATGGLRCLSQTSGGSTYTPTIVAGTNAFINPC